MGNEAISQALIRQQGFALFEYLGDRTFRLVAEPPDFWHDLPGVGHATETPIKLGDQFPFLDQFLIEAERIWASRSDTCAESGFWIEKSISGRELALEARALWLVGTPILALQNSQEGYKREVWLQQKARDSVLIQERLLREIENKEILLHCVAHDLVQPLAVLRACLTLLSVEEKFSPSLKLAVEAAERQCRRQEEVIRGILEAFSAELGARQAIEEDPEKAPDLARCERIVVGTFRNAFAEQHVRLELDSEVDLSRIWRVRGDEAHLLRVFGNLVENALRRTPPESTVKLSVRDEGEFLYAFVDDAGPEVPESESAEGLFAISGKSKEEHEGKAELGLYFCKITIERWGGAIGCLTLSTGGARFWFRLPRVQGKTAIPKVSPQ
jgi:signal transduction histidine kinase